DVMAPIAGIQVGRLAKLLAEREIALGVSDSAMALLAEEGFDPAMGARPLKRVIQREIENPLSLSLLKGEFGQGDGIRFSLDGAGKGLVLSKV
ncbi:MAG: hypothetical protein MI747_11645, partial [Desulfobacterales bacterium]|nr:hypothetical protein [Desulfobacterales bacterium]